MNKQNKNIMTQEQFEKAQPIVEKIALLTKEYVKWELSESMAIVKLREKNQKDFTAVDLNLIDFPKLRTETMASIKAKIDELQTVFDNL